MLLSFLLALLPSPIHVLIRRLLGARIGPSARIRFGSILRVKRLDIGGGTSIGPFSMVRADTFKTGEHCEIRPLTMLNASQVEIGDYSHIGLGVIVASEGRPRSRFILGRHCLINPFCFIEAGEGVTIGDQTGVGGRSMIFTHAVWADYLRGGIVNYGPVVVENDAWIAWGVSILANVVIGRESMVAAGSVVNKSIPPKSLAVGVPAKVIPGMMGRQLSTEERRHRARRILADYAETGLPAKEQPAPKVTSNGLEFGSTIAIDDTSALSDGDLLVQVGDRLTEAERISLVARGISVLDHPHRRIYLASKRAYLEDFIEFLNRYGVRLDTFNK